jgi:hypothetical protein
MSQYLILFQSLKFLDSKRLKFLGVELKTSPCYNELNCKRVIFNNIFILFSLIVFNRSDWFAAVLMNY